MLFTIFLAVVTTIVYNYCVVVCYSYLKSQNCGIVYGNICCFVVPKEALVGCHLVSEDTKTLGVSGSGVLRFKLIPYIFEVGTCLRLFFWFFLYFRMRTATIFCENTFLCEYFVTLITTFKIPKKEPSRPNG